MRNRRKRRRTPIRYDRVALLVVIALLVPMSVNWLSHNFDLLERTGEQAAMLAAAINMPEEGLDLLRERWEEELYPGHPDEHTPGLSEGTPYRAPEPETGQSSATDGEGESVSPPRAQPKIPDAYKAELVSENFGVTQYDGLVWHGAGAIKNETALSDEEVETILETPFAIEFEDTDEPQVLIVHTHATEAFERYDSEYYDTRNTWRSRDNNMNMVAVGAAMTEVLEQNGIGVIHDTIQHDYPSYNGSYERSAATIEGYLEEYPTIKVVLDLHRDAMERDGGQIVKPVTEIGGEKAAQVMIIAACDNDGSLGVPEYRQNLRFAAALADSVEGSYPGLSRPVYFCYRKYNMDLTTGSLLLEFGSNANTLDEAVYAAEMVGQALADLIQENIA